MQFIKDHLEAILLGMAGLQTLAAAVHASYPDSAVDKALSVVARVCMFDLRAMVGKALPPAPPQ